MRVYGIALALLFAAWTAEAVRGQGPRTATPTVGLRDLSPDAYALENAAIVVRPGTTIARGTVLIRNGSILAVGDDVAIPPGTKRIDHRGHRVYAGLIDAFSEADVPNPSRDTGAPHWNDNVVPQRSAARVAGAGAMDVKKLRSQGITLRLVAPQDGIIKGTSCLILAGDGESGQLLLRDTVWHHLSLTAPRRRSGTYPNSPMGAVALLRQSVSDARWYGDAHAAYRANPSLARPDSDTALAALADAVDASVFVVDAPNERMAQRADAIAKELRLKIILRGSGREYRQLGEIAAQGHPLLLPVDFPDAPKIENAADARETTLVDLLDWELAPSNPARLAQAGVTFCLTTDGLEDPARFLQQVRTAVEAGLDADQALAALTVRPAELLGVADWAGTVQPGRLANLVVTDGDLFAESTKVLETWVAGKQYEVAAASDEHLESMAGCWKIDVPPGQVSPIGPLTMQLTKKKSALSGSLWRVENQDANATVDEEQDMDADKDADADQDTDGDAGDDRGDEEGSDEAGGDDQQEPKPDDDASQDADWPQDANEKVAEGQQVPAPAKAELQRVVRERDRLSGSVDLSTIDETLPAGVSWLSLVTLQNPDGESVVVEGSLRLPGGESIAVVVQRVAEKCCSTDSAARDEQPGDDRSDDDESGESGSDKPASDEPGPEESESKEGNVDAQASIETSAIDAAHSDADSEGDAASEEDVEVVYPLGSHGLAELPAARPLVMFRGATVWTCGPSGTIEGDVLVRDGRIEAVGKQLDAPEGCEIVDLQGKHLTPGLIDCHSHIATDGGVNESAQAITAEVRVGDFIDNSDISIYRQLAGGLTTANILHGSANPIGGQNQVVKLRWGATMDQMRFDGAPRGIKFALGENPKRSAGRYPDTRMGVEQIIRDQLMAAKEYRTAHRMYRSGNREMLPPRIDLQLEALAEVLEGDRWIHCHSYRQDEIVALLDVLDAFDIQIGSLQHILEGYKVADRLRASGAMASSFSDWWAYKFEVYDAIPYNGALMHANGIVVSFNSDDAELARHLNTEAAKAVKYGGVPAEEALKFVTLNPARQLRIDDRVGSLEAGKDADLVVWSRPPLSTLTRCEQTWIDGRCYFSLQADAQLRDRDARWHARLVQKILSDDGKRSGARKPRVDEEDRWHRHDIYCGHDGHDHHEAEHEINERLAEEAL